MPLNAGKGADELIEAARRRQRTSQRSNQLSKPPNTQGPKKTTMRRSPQSSFQIFLNKFLRRRQLSGIESLRKNAAQLRKNTAPNTKQARERSGYRDFWERIGEDEFDELKEHRQRIESWNYPIKKFSVKYRSGIVETPLNLRCQRDTADLRVMKKGEQQHYLLIPFLPLKTPQILQPIVRVTMDSGNQFTLHLEDMERPIDAVSRINKEVGHIERLIEGLKSVRTDYYERTQSAFNLEEGNISDPRVKRDLLNFIDYYETARAGIKMKEMIWNGVALRIDTLFPKNAKDAISPLTALSLLGRVLEERKNILERYVSDLKRFAGEIPVN